MKRNRNTSTRGKAIRRAERANRAANDPYFGKRRRAGEMGNKRSKAARNKAACRGGMEL